MTKRGCAVIGEGGSGAWSGAVLADQLLDYDLVVGVSSGSLNACGYSLLGANHVDFIRSVNSILDVFELNPCMLWQSGMLQADPLVEKLRIYWEGKQFQYAVKFPTVHVQSGQLMWHTFAAGDYCDDEAIHLIAGAAAIPGLVRDVRGHVDGGIRVICPLKPLVDDGCDEIDIVMADSPFLAPEWPRLDKFDIGKAAWMALAAVKSMLWQLMVDDIELALKCNDRPDKREIGITLKYPGKRIGSVLGFRDCVELTDLTKHPVFELRLD